MIKRVLTSVTALLLALTAGQSASEVVTVTWTAPTAYVNGAPLPASDLHSYDIQCVAFTPTNGSPGPCPNGAGLLTVPGTATAASYDLGTVPPSGGLYELSARARVVSLAESTWSNPAGKTYVAVPPSPPSGLTAVEGIAYTLRSNGSGARLGYVVGTVPKGTACGAEMLTRRGNKGYYEVPASAVALSGPHTGPFVAYCTGA